MKRLAIRYERRADIHDALLTLGCSLICLNFLRAPQRRPAMPKRPAPAPDSLAARYPTLATWVQDGWIEIGYTDHTRSFVRAFDEGGMVWEGAERYPSLDAALGALDAGIAAWIEEHG